MAFLTHSGRFPRFPPQAFLLLFAFRDTSGVATVIRNKKIGVKITSKITSNHPKLDKVDFNPNHNNRDTSLDSNASERDYDLVRGVTTSSYIPKFLPSRPMQSQNSLENGSLDTNLPGPEFSVKNSPTDPSKR